EFGYDAEWSLLNSKNFGVPQNRERVFIIGHLRGTGGRAVFPIGGENKEVNENYIKPVNDSKKVRDQLKYDSINRFYDPIGISPCLDTMGGGNREPKIIQPVLTPDRIEKRQNGRRFKEDGEPMFTLTSQDRHGVAILKSSRTEYGKKVRKDYEDGKIKESRHNMNKLEPRDDGITNTITTVQKDNLLKNGFRIRKLTPLECFRLQGFTDEQFYKAKNDGVSNSQLYKQAGNSVSVPVIKAIAERL